MPGILAADRSGMSARPIISIGVPPNVNARSTFAMSDAAAYANNSDGAAMAGAFVAKTTSPVKYVHVFKSLTTAGAGDDAWTFEVRDYDPATTLKPKTGTPRATGTGVFGTTGTNKFLRSPDLSGGAAALTVGEIYWIVVGNTSSGPSTSYPTMLSTSIIPGNDQNIFATVLKGLTTTTGFNTNGTGTNGPMMIVEHADGTLSGMSPLTLNSGATWGGANHARDRGAFWSGPSRPFEFSAFTAANLTNVTHLDIRTGEMAPSSTPLFTHTVTANQAASFGAMYLPTNYVFQPNENGYVITMRVSGSIASPRHLECEDTGYANIDTIWPQAPEGGKFFAIHKHSSNDEWEAGWGRGQNGLPNTASITATGNSNLKYRVPLLALHGFDFFQTPDQGLSF